MQKSIFSNIEKQPEDKDQNDLSNYGRVQQTGEVEDDINDVNSPQLTPSTRKIKTLRDSGHVLSFRKKELAENDDLCIDKDEGSFGYLKISVVDTGCGISEDGVKKLFKKFSQVGNEAQRKVGTGLGLWISKELAERMGGTIRVRSRPGVGSVFEVCIKCPVTLSCQSCA